METLKTIYDRVSHILEKHAQLNKEASACLQSLGYNGFKRLHRYNCKKFQYWQMKLANILFNIKREKLDMQAMNINYAPMDLKEHLRKWLEELEYALKELGELNKHHFETCGKTSDIIECAMCLMLDDLGNIQRWQHQGEATDWLEMFLFILDDKIHCKYKKKEEED
ncbi:MAG: hypothetical protein IKU37_08940 [Candidatus Gastranaerophilales bacterium]|nr:hypothetical protein [Candidatus Gastranaerophilales bacterium]